MYTIYSLENNFVIMQDLTKYTLYEQKTNVYEQIEINTKLKNQICTKIIDLKYMDKISSKSTHSQTDHAIFRQIKMCRTRIPNICRDDRKKLRSDRKVTKG